MDSHYLQQQRYLLQKRFRQLGSCNHLLFHSTVVQIWRSIHANPLLAGILFDISQSAPSFESEIQGIFSDGWQIFEERHEAIEFCFRVFEYCATRPVGQDPEKKIGRALTQASNYSDIVREFYEVVAEPLYEHLDEALDGHVAALSLLLKYKRKVEWFERGAMAATAGKDERQLAQHLYAYLFDQGLDFSIEPKSVSGIADLISPELVLDAKVFDGRGRDVKYLAKGVNQVHSYAVDFNQNAAYLVIYKVCDSQLIFEFARPNDLVPFISVGHKTVFFVVIDVHEYEQSASKRGAFRTITVAESELRSEVDLRLAVQAESAPVETHTSAS